MTAVEDTSRGRKREGRRRGEPSQTRIQQQPFAQPRLTLDPIKFVSDDQLESIHEASMRLLEEVGMEVILNTEALEIYKRAGCKVDGERVRIGRELVDEALRRAPSEFVLNARNPAHSVRFGGNWIVFGPVGGPPNCSDMDRGRRPGTLEDNANFVKLSQFFNCIHTAHGGSVDALDIHASVRHLHILRNKVLYAQAETQNVRRRLEKEKTDASAYASTAFARDMLSVADNLSRALSSIPADLAGDEKLKPVLTGIEMTARELENVFQRHGITRIAAMGEALDPNKHQAMLELERADAAPGTIVEEMQSGYMIRDRLLRPALVGVAKAPPVRVDIEG